MNEFTFDDIKLGLIKGFVNLTEDPNSDYGTVCAIGDNWFYFGGSEAEEYTSDEYIRKTPTDIIIQNILDALNELKEIYIDEYLYYYFYLEECGIVNQKRV